MTQGHFRAIGHSNGAGLMASFAKNISKLMNTKVGELDVLDAPVLHSAWNEVMSAAGLVVQVNFVYTTKRSVTRNVTLRDNSLKNVDLGQNHC